MDNDVHSSDFLVIGSGISGLLFSLKASRRGAVNLITKRLLTDTATYLAQGGIAAVVSAKDSFEKHIEDTIRAGAGLCHPDVVDSFVRAGPARISEIVKLGVKFNKASDREGYDLGLEGGHSNRRILHVKDHTGQDVETVLAQRIREESRISIWERHMAVNLFVRNNRVLGAHVLDVKTGEIKRFAAKVTILATGGAGKVFLYTSNPEHSTGDGIAMAYRAGATITNMEFIQFHPTLLYHPKIRSFLITEALRGEGAVLLGPDGKRFMQNYHPDAELAPRDVVTRAIDAELKRTGAECVFLDISFKDGDFVKERFPVIYETCLKAGIDMTREPIPVVPGAHYLCGGVRVDKNGRSDVDGLYVVGESAGTGFHGANRLASNSLLEGAILGHNASLAASEEGAKIRLNTDIPPWDPGQATDTDELVVISHMWDEVRRLMQNYVGVVRSNKRLLRARNRIEFLSKEINEFYWDFRVTSDLVELRNIATVAELIIRSARMRRESRGAHFNKDYPNQSNEAVDTLIKKGYARIE